MSYLNLRDLEVFLEIFLTIFIVINASEKVYTFLLIWAMEVSWSLLYWSHIYIFFRNSKNAMSGLVHLFQDLFFFKSVCSSSFSHQKKLCYQNNLIFYAHLLSKIKTLFIEF